MQMSAVESNPIFNILFSFLRYLHSTVVVPSNKAVVSQFKGEDGD